MTLLFGKQQKRITTFFQEIFNKYFTHSSKNSVKEWINKSSKLIEISTSL